jgi:predicted transcriptional regulator
MVTMTTPDRHSDALDGLSLLLGPRQAQIMRLFWAFGSATAREIHTRLLQDTALAYTTVATICARLAEMGLLHQQLVTGSNGSVRYPPTNRYTPLISEADFVRTEVSQQLDRLLTHFPAIVCDRIARSGQLRPSSDGIEQTTDRASVEGLLAYLRACQTADGQPIDTTALDMIATVLTRAEAAERLAVAQAAEANRAQLQAQAATRRAVAAECQAEDWKAEAHRAHQRALLLQEEEAAAAQHRVQMQEYAKAKAVVEHYGPEGICRVCGQAAPYIPTRRRDGLRFCINPECKREAHRRDNLAKQRQFKERRRLQRAQRAATS